MERREKNGKLDLETEVERNRRIIRRSRDTLANLDRHLRQSQLIGVKPANPQ